MKKRNKNIQIVFIYQKWIVGGYELLCLKLARCYKEKGINIRVLFQEMDEYFRVRFLEMNMELIEIKDWWSLREYKSAMLFNGSTLIFASVLNDYIKARMILGKRIRAMLYLPGPTVLKMIEDDYLYSVNSFLTKKMLDNEIKNNHCVAMDVDNIDVAIQLYRNPEWRDEIEIVSIGNELVDLDKESLELKLSSFSPFRILTVARAQFPMKGYMIGLLELLSQIITDKKIELIIVSYGADIEKVKEKIKNTSFPDNVSIELKDKMDYEELKDLYAESHLYIGMGTTIIDASQNGTISIPIKYGTYNVEGDCFFYERPSELCFCGENSSIDSLVERAINMSPDQYREAVKKTIDSTKKIYDINVSAKSLLSKWRKMEVNVIDKNVLMVFAFRYIMHRFKNRKLFRF